MDMSFMDGWDKKGELEIDRGIIKMKEGLVGLLLRGFMRVVMPPLGRRFFITE